MSSDEDEPLKKKLKGGDGLPTCPYGERCCRKNPQHFKEYSHPDKNKNSSGDAPESSSANSSDLPPCKYGVNCYRKNLLHFAEYWHPFKGDTADDKSDGDQSEDSGGDTDTDIQHLEDEEDKKSKLVKSKTDFLKRGASLIKSFTKMTEDERKELIKQAFEAKQHLQDKLKDSNEKIEKQSKELDRLQQEVNTGTLLMEGEENVLKGKEMKKYPLVAERAYKEGSAAQVHFRLAESQFYRLVSGQGGGYRVTKVEYVVNPELVKRFKQAREDMKKFRSEDMSYPVLAFHRTQETNIDPICKTGFRVPGESGFKHRTDTGWYGKGVYFSEFPTYSMSYIQGATKLLLCQVLLGKVFQCTKLIHGKPLTSGYDSHTSPDKKELVIFNAHHILPCYIVHYENTNKEFKYVEKKAAIVKKAKKTKAQMAAAYQKAQKTRKSKIFAGQGFTLLGNIADTHANIQNLLVKHGGSKLSTGLLNPIITSEAALKAPGNSAALANARNTNVPILREDYIYDCISGKKLLDKDPYLLDCILYGYVPLFQRTGKSFIILEITFCKTVHKLPDAFSIFHKAWVA